MKFVDQKEPDNYLTGDCFSACVASILELPIEEVPNFFHCNDFWDGCNKFLANRGYKKHHWHFDDMKQLKETEFAPKADYRYGILCLPDDITDEGREIYHAVVAFTFQKGLYVVHNPHPSRKTNIPDEGKPYLIFLEKQGLDNTNIYGSKN
jgi:hypothetical protein